MSHLTAKDGVASGQTRCVLVYLYRGNITLELENITYRLGMADTDKILHGYLRYVVNNNEGASHLEDEAVPRFFFFFMGAQIERGRG